jgi:hypothetical protein
MICVVVNHSKRSSVLSWFSYERFWTVTAAEVFVVLSGIVVGMVYGKKLKRGDWTGVVSGLTRRTIVLYVSFIAVALSVALLERSGADIGEILLMRSGPWSFEIIGMYVWLVAAAVPCLLGLRYVGVIPVLGASWALFLWYRISPHSLTGAEFETSFPLLAWQILFVHALAIGYHRDRVYAFVEARVKPLTIAAMAAMAGFIAFALCNPWTDGPGLLHLTSLDPDYFAELYARFFGLEELGVGRLLNLLVGLPLAYGALTAVWRIAAPVGKLFITLGQQSLGAFVLHVYAIMLIAHTSPPEGLWRNTLLQIAAILAIAAVLNGMQRWPFRRARAASAPRPLPA